MSVQAYTFSELMSRVQQGDSSALRWVLDEYGEAIQREVRFTLLDARLRRFVGESDVYQSVVLRFFSGMRDGKYRIDTPKDLVALLKGIARTRIAELVRFWHAQRRDLSRNTRLTACAMGEVIAGEPCPTDVLMRAELAEAAEKRLSARDRQVLRWRDEGQAWSEIAGRLGAASGEAVRKQHERSLARLAGELDGTKKALFGKPK